MRVLICSQPIIGHVEPGLVIAKALVERGHQVAWYTGSSARSYVESKGYRVFGFKRAFDYDGENPNLYFPDREGLTGLADLKFILKRVFAASMPLQAEDLTEILAQFPADVLLADLVTFGPRVLSERGGPPWAAYGLSALSLSSCDTAPYGLGLMPTSTRVGKLRNRALNWLFKRVALRDIVADYDRQRTRLGLPALDAGPTDTPLSPYLFLQGTVPEFEYPRSDLAPQVHFVGALTPEPRASEWARPSWWHEVTSGNLPVVLVTQGTMDNHDLGELMQPALDALAHERLQVVVTTGRELRQGELRIPDNARVARFLPYQELLPHVQVMVTNGGYNGVSIALANGVPLIVSGYHSDKPEICARVRWSGAGVHLRGRPPSLPATRDAVARVLGDGRYKAHALALAKAFRRHDAGRASAALLEQLALTKRPILRAEQGSASRDWQRGGSASLHRRSIWSARR